MQVAKMSKVKIFKTFALIISIACGTWLQDPLLWSDIALVTG